MRKGRRERKGYGAAALAWDEVADVEPRECTIATVPERFACLGDLHATIDDVAHDLTPLLEWVDRDEAEGAEPPADPEA